MKRFIFACILSLTLLLFASVLWCGGKVAADIPKDSGTARIGYVDFNQALNEVTDGKRAKQRLKDAFQEKQQQLDRLQAELKGAKDALDRDRLLLSPEAMEKREREYRQKYAELGERLEMFKREMSNKEAEFTKDILNRLHSIVRDIGKDEGYSLILEKSQDVVLYAPEGNDLTGRVIAAYDQGRGGKKK